MQWKIKKLAFFNIALFNGYCEIEPKGENLLITGKNGVGKSSMYDAYKMSIAGQKIPFNAMSGAKNRSVLGYLKGEYGNGSLRGGKDFTSLVATTYESNGEVFTIITVWEVSANENIKKSFWSARREISKEEVEHIFGIRPYLKSELKELGFIKKETILPELAYVGISEEVRDNIVKSHSVSNQTHLTELVKRILPSVDMEKTLSKEIAKGVDLYSQEVKAREDLRNCKEKIESLDEICKLGEECQNIEQVIREEEFIEKYLMTIAIDKQTTLNTQEIERLKGELAELVKEESVLDREIKTNEEKRVKVLSDLSGFGNVSDKKRELEELGKKDKEISDNLLALNILVKSLGLETVKSQNTYLKRREEVKALVEELQESRNNLYDEKGDLSSKVNSLEKKIKDKGNELEEALKRKNNIPSEQAKMMGKLLRAKEELEGKVWFVGELLRPTENHKLVEAGLGAYACHIVVPKSYEAEIFDLIEKKRLVPMDFLFLEENAELKEGVENHVWNMVEFKQTPFRNALSNYIKSLPLFVSDLKGLVDNSGIADFGFIVKQEALSSAKQPLSYFGWTNETRVSELKTEIELLELEKEECLERLNIVIEHLSTLNRKLTEVNRLEFCLEADYEKYDVAGISDKIKFVEQEIKKMESALTTDKRALKETYEKLKDELLEKIQKLEKELRKVVEKKGVVNKTLSELTDNNESLAREARMNVPPAIENQLALLLEEEFESSTRKGKNHYQIAEIRVGKAKLVINIKRDQFTTTEESLKRQQKIFAKNFENLGEGLGFIDDYQSSLEKEKKNKFELIEKKTNKINRDHLIDQLRLVGNTISNQQKKLEEAIDKRNLIMRANPFTANSYVEFKAKAISDKKQDYKSFWDDLQKLILSNKLTDEEFDAIASSVFSKMKDEKWVEDNLEPKNRMSYEVQEIDQETGKPKRNLGAGNGSGGETESALYYLYAMTFIDSNTDVEDTFSCIILDEAFAKCDKTKATHLTSIFKQLGLQLVAISPEKDLNLEDFPTKVLVKRENEATTLAFISKDQQVAESEQKEFEVVKMNA